MRQVYDSIEQSVLTHRVKYATNETYMVIKAASLDY